MNKFFLKILLTLSLFAGSAHAALITPKVKRLNADAVKAITDYKHVILEAQLADLRAGEIENLAEEDRPKIGAKANLPSHVLDLIYGYDAEQEEKKEDAELKEVAAAQALPHNNDPDLNFKNKVEQKKEAILAAQACHQQWHDHIAAKKRQFCADYERFLEQKRLNPAYAQHYFVYSCIGLWHCALQKDFFFFLSKYPILHERVKTACLGGIKALLATSCYLLYNNGIGPVFNNSPISYEKCMPQNIFIHPLRIAGTYMLLDLIHKYGADIINKKINFRKHDDALQAYFADPDIDIDYQAATKRLGWLIKTIIAGRLTSTYV